MTGVAVTGYVYVVEAKESGHIKVGYSVNPQQRLRQLQTSSHEKLDLLFQVPARKMDEESIHRTLRPVRVRGEWYRDLASVRTVMHEKILRDDARIAFELATVKQQLS